MVQNFKKKYDRSLSRNPLIKVQKPWFYGIFDHFWSFLRAGDFFQKIQFRHTQLYMTPEKFSKKLMSQFRENVQTDGRTNGKKDGRADPIS